MNNIFTPKKFGVFVKKHYMLIFMLLCGTLLLVYKTIPAANAITDHAELEKEFNTFLEGIGKTMLERMTKSYALFFGSSDSFWRSGVYTTATAALRTFIMGIACGILVIYSLIGVIKESMKGEVSMDYWFRIFASTVVAVIVLTSIQTITSRLGDLGGAIVNTVSTESENQTKKDGTIQKIGKDKWEEYLSVLPMMSGTGQAGALSGSSNSGSSSGTGGSFKDVMNNNDSSTDWYTVQQMESVLRVMNYIVYIPVLAAYFLFFSAVFELKIREIFAPLAVSTIAHEGARSSGVRFLKKYFAIYIKMAVYFIIAVIGYEFTLFFYNRLANAKDAETVLISVVLMMISNFVAAMTMMQSGGIGDEIVGV